MSEPGSKRGRQRKARKYALDILFAADLRTCPVDDVLDGYAMMSAHEIPNYSVKLAKGVEANGYLIDGYLAPCLNENWTVERMPRIDRILARIACFEMIYQELPASVAISEAVALAGELSTDASAGFLNGVLAQVATLIPGALPKTQAVEPQAPADEDEGHDDLGPLFESAVLSYDDEADASDGVGGTAVAVGEDLADG